MKEPLKVGDEVWAYVDPMNAKQFDSWKYFFGDGVPRSRGKVLRVLGNGNVRVDLHDTASQDSEGHNAYFDFHPRMLARLKLRKARRK